ncbi:MAG: hypothetical protein KJ737_05385 [Proteobacteria bacterium]|nr:hypothetical protein [Pseudomonadota bacterium]
MYLQFKEEFERPLNEVYSYFKTPAEWTRLYGSGEPVKTLKNGWYAVYLTKFPFPLVAKIVEDSFEKKVRWIFSRFWRGVGEIRFSRVGDKTIVEGYEYIIPHGLWLFAPLFEKLVLRKGFVAIWERGWRRLRQKSFT